MKISKPGFSVFSPLLLVIAVGAVFAYYYWSYVPTRTSNFDQHNFRVLSRINDNISHRFSSLKKQLPKLKSNSKCQCEKVDDQLYRWDCDDHVRYEVSATDPCKVGDRQGVMDENRIAAVDFKSINAGIIKIDAFEQQVTNQDDAPTIEPYVEELKGEGISFVADGALYVLKPNQVFSYLYRNDVFDEFLILRFEDELDEEISKIFKDEKTAGKVSLSTDFNTIAHPKKHAEIIDPGNLKGLFDSQFDTLSNFSNDRGLNVVNLSIDVSNYRLYFQNIVLEDQNFVICGLYGASKFNGKVTRIPVYVIIIVIFGALVLSLALPSIKLALVNKYERNNKNDVFTVSVSSVLGVGVITLFIFFIMYFADSYEKEKQNTLVNLSDSIHTNLTEEVQDILSQIDFFEAMIREVKSDASANRKEISHSLQNILNGASWYKKEFGFSPSGPGMFQPTAALNSDKTRERLNNLRSEGQALEGGMQVLLNKKMPKTFDASETASRYILTSYLDLSKRCFDYFIEYNAVQFDVLYGTSVENIEIFNDLMHLQDCIKQLKQQVDLHVSKYPYFFSYSMVGDYAQRLKWVTNSIPPSFVTDLKDREYVNRLLSNSGWVLPLNDHVHYYFEPVFSKTTGKITTEVSSKNSGHVVNNSFANISVISTKLYSLSKPVIPEGVHYAIIDAKGEVKYHHDERHALQENFLEECSDAGDFVSAIANQKPIFGKTNYHNEGIQYFIRPIDNTEYYLITFRDLKFQNYALLNSLSISFSLFLIIVIALLFLSYLQHLFLLPKYRYIRRKYFLDWMRPKVVNVKTYLDNVKKRGEPGQEENFESLDPFVDNCIKLFVFQLLGAAFVFCISFFVLTPDQSLYAVFSAFVLPIIFFPYSYNLLNLQKFSQMSLARKMRNLMPALLVLAVINTLVGIYVNDTKTTIILILIQLLIGLFPVLFLASKKFNFYLTETCKRWFSGIVYGSSDLEHFKLLKIRLIPYYLCLTLWIVFIAILPNLVFMKHYYDAEKVLFTAYRESELTKDIQGRTVELQQRWSSTWQRERDESKKKYLNEKNKYDLGQYSVRFNSPLEIEYKLENSNVLAKLSWLRASFNEYNQVTQHLLSPPLQFSLDSMSVKYYADQRTKSDSFIAPIGVTANSSFNLDFDYRVWLMGIVSFLLVLFLIYQLVKFISVKLFATNSVLNFEMSRYLGPQLDPTKSYLIWYPNEEIPIEDHDDFSLNDLEFLDKQLDDAVRLSAFISKLQEKLEGGNRVLLVSSHDMYGVDHLLEANINSEELFSARKKWEDAASNWNSFKLNLTEWIVSIQKGTGETEEVESLAKEILGDSCPGKEKNELGYLRLKRDLVVEFSQSPQLFEIGKELLQFVQKSKEGLRLSFEEIVVKLEETATSYYFSLWNQCSDVEKFVLYDLSRDGYVNTRNDDIIFRLCKKGLITCNGSLSIMNESFRNFIYRHMEPELIKKIEKNVAEKGRWSKLRTPIILVLVAIAAFIFVTQEEFLLKIHCVLNYFAYDTSGSS